MKLSLAILSAVVLTLTSVPVLFATGDAGPAAPTACTLSPTDGLQPLDLDAILATIRARESGGNYTAQATGSSASGAYQFTNATWAHHDGYPRAASAPPAVQDAKATAHVQGILDAHDNDVAAIPVVWYLGYLPPAADPAWDDIPGPGGTNRLTPRQYQAEWLDTYRQQLADEPTAPTDSCMIGGAALPGPTDLFAQAPVDNPHHDYPAWDWPIPAGTPIYAIHGGQVASITTWARNWYDEPCQPGERCSRCGIGATVVDDQGTRWSYCHGSRLHVDAGDVITADTQILTSGNTGRSTTPHLHLAIRTADDQARCPQPLLAALQGRAPVPDPADLPTTGCTS